MIEFFAVLFIHTNVNSSHTVIVFLIMNSWETYLQKLIDFLLNPFFVFRNGLYVNLLYYMNTCCYTKNELKLLTNSYTMACPPVRGDNP